MYSIKRIVVIVLSIVILSTFSSLSASAASVSKIPNYVPCASTKWVRVETDTASVSGSVNIATTANLYAQEDIHSSEVCGSFYASGTVTIGSGSSISSGVVRLEDSNGTTIVYKNIGAYGAGTYAFQTGSASLDPVRAAFITNNPLVTNAATTSFFSY